LNYIDYGILAIIFITTLIGIYSGFVVSALNIVSTFFSWLASVVFYPILSKFLTLKYPDLLEKIIHYSEGSSRIHSIEDRMLLVSNLTEEQITNIINRAQLPPPFNRLLFSNLVNHRLEHLETLGEYFDYTIAAVILNIAAFILLFLIIRAILLIIISVAKEVIGLPVLKEFDGAFAAGLGVIRGIFCMFLVFAVLPLILILAPLDIIYTFIENSFLGKFFFESNIFTNAVKGITSIIFCICK
jgi:uncharacterized membrane protein required for colicin V production